MKKAIEIGGYVGMALIHGATLPTIIQTLSNPETATLPPLSMVLMVWAGLALFLVRAVAQRDLLYTLSNAVGFIFNTALLVLILKG